MLHFTFDAFPPYAAKIVTVKADLLLSSGVNTLTVPDMQFFLKPEKYIESDNPALYRKAQRLKGATPLKTAENIFHWVADNIDYAGYLKNNRGALYALTHREGDCSEFMYLFAALCRSDSFLLIFG